MKYTYYYQTSQNENKTGTIDARDRADAYTRLRKQGIRPYRIAGDDPARWRRWLPTAVIVIPLAVISVIAVVFSYTAATSDTDSPIARQQLVGDEAFIVEQVKSNWADVLPSELDRYLAAYAQPGWKVEMPVPPASAIEGLKRPLTLDSADRPEVHQLKRILLQMRAELSELVENGGTLDDYAKIVTDRQDTEAALRTKAIDSFLSTPPSLRRKAFASLNICLRDRNIAPLPVSLLSASGF